MPPVNSGGSPTTASSMSRQPDGRSRTAAPNAASVATPRPRNTASPSAMSGTARGVLRSARPFALSSSVLPPLAGERRVVPWVRADRDEQADEHEHGEVRAVLPSADRGADQRECREQVGDRDEPQSLRVVDARLRSTARGGRCRRRTSSRDRAATRERPTPTPPPPRSPCTGGSGCRSRSAPTGRRSTTATSPA